LASGVARGAGRTGAAVRLPSETALRATRAPRRGGDPRPPAAPRGRAVRFVLLAAAALATLAAALLLGPANVPLGELTTSPIIWQLRLPRALLAFLVGGALGVSGVGLQALVRNPLADPFLLGLSGGAGLGEEPAQYLGADVRRLKQLVYLSASLLTAAAVAVAGVIGFVGLIVPHICRLVWGRLHHTLFPTAFLTGGIFLAAADTVARTVVAPRE